MWRGSKLGIVTDIDLKLIDFISTPHVPYLACPVRLYLAKPRILRVSHVNLALK